MEVGKSDGLASIQCYFYIGLVPAERVGAQNVSGYLYAYVSNTRLSVLRLQVTFWCLKTTVQEGEKANR